VNPGAEGFDAPAAGGFGGAGYGDAAAGDGGEAVPEDGALVMAEDEGGVDGLAAHGGVVAGDVIGVRFARCEMDAGAGFDFGWQDIVDGHDGQSYRHCFKNDDAIAFRMGGVQEQVPAPHESGDLLGGLLGEVANVCFVTVGAELAERVLDFVGTASANDIEGEGNLTLTQEGHGFNELRDAFIGNKHADET
jgi:hypothetical protein